MLDTQHDSRERRDLSALMTTPGFRRDPWSTYATFREHDPVHFAEGSGAWYLLRHADVRGALTGDSFGAAHPFRASRQAMGPTLVDLDGARHTVLKACLRPFFTRRQVEDDYTLRVVRPVVDDLLDALAATREPDLMRDLASQLPIRVVLRVLGLPEEDAPRLLRDLTPIVRYVDSTAASLEAAARGRERLTACLQQALDDPDGSSLGGLLGRLARAASDSGIPTRQDVMQIAVLLLVAGTETTTSAIGNVLAAVLADSDEWQRLKLEPARRETVVREALRWQPPLHTTLRFARRDVALHGRLIPLGSPVQLSLASANRDERRFPAADRFVPDRPRVSDLTFGAGAHACLGLVLAQAEIHAVLADMLDRFEDIRPHFPSPVETEGVNFRRPVALPVGVIA